MTKPDLRSYYGDKTHVGLVSILDAAESNAFRSILENLEAVVHLRPVGTPVDFLKVIASDELPDFLIISCHGGENGIHFGDFAQGIDVSTLVDGYMPSHHIAHAGRFSGSLVINTGCGCGSASVADHFLEAGARGYIGTEPDPDWRAHSLFVHHFFYEIIRSGSDEGAAWEQAATYDADSRCFLLYDSEGCHSIR